MGTKCCNSKVDNRVSKKRSVGKSGNPLRLGRRDSRFESGHSDFLLDISVIYRTVSLAECSSVWLSVAFGTLRPQVRILSLRVDVAP